MSDIDKYNELKEKISSVRGGYMKLSGEERAVYSELRKKFEDSENQGSDAEVQFEKVDVDSSSKEKNQAEQIEYLLRKTQELEQAVAKAESEKKELQDQPQTGWHQKKNSPKKKTATLMIWREDTDSHWNVIVDRKFLKKVWDADHQMYRQIYKVLMIDKDSNQITKEMDLLELGQIKDFITVTIEGEDIQKQQRMVGRTIHRQNYAFSQYSSKIAEQVPLYEERVQAKYKVLLPDGRTMFVEGRVLNGS